MEVDIAEVHSNSLKTVNIRPDGRGPTDFRPTKFKWNVMKNADGSCYYEQGNAKVLCSVFGPLQRFKMRKLDNSAILRCHLYTSRLSGADRRRMKARSDKETHSVLESALSSIVLLDQYPRTRIDVVFRILHSDGNNIAVCLNAANFALMDAGIYMKGLLTVAACSYSNDNVIVDISDLDQQESNGAVLVGSINGKNEISFLDVRGCFSKLIFKDIIRTALAANAKLDDLFAKETMGGLKSIYVESESVQLPQMAALTIKETSDAKGDTIPQIFFEDYDKAFKQLVLSDSEDEEME
ncbi:unnamed protein product [Bursaphelenchus xylophilus]|uniref:(pine wood nematode) hypothetical protein n=1 Tax=Bursaphelenchus xylophilus TaxID=6326 RepID=A0A1I7RHD3_BURXY|nr:unnamed protein product [Bursaphelenchus xylophilus]CAG9115835.1 unnamed protein product [Bursaphelenchus xylophilus]